MVIINQKVCPVCNGTGLIYDGFRKRYSKCVCNNNKIIANAMRQMSEEELKKSFKNYTSWNNTIKNMKDVTTSYYLRFESIKNKRNNSYALLGADGIGKTHLLMALANFFIFKNGLNIEYISSRNLKSLEDTRKINRCKSCELLIIDSLLESKEFIEEIYDVFRYRRAKRLPIAINSNLSISEMKDTNCGIGNMVEEATEGNRYSVCNDENIYKEKSQCI